MEPENFIYISIGSCPHAMQLDVLNEKWDQMVPTFLRPHILDGQCVQAILIDPLFSENERFRFLTSYLSKLQTQLKLHFEIISDTAENVVTGNFVTHYLARSKNFRLDVFCDRFDEKNLFHLNTYIDQTLQTQDSKLILQQFTGAESTTLAKSLFESSKNKSLFCDRVLIDMTYGDASCSTDMSVTFPLYILPGKFFNFLLYSDSFLRELDFTILHLDAKVYIIRYFKKVYKNTLNRRHVDFRRTSKNEECLFQENKHLTSIGIFVQLQKELWTTVKLLQKLDVFHQDKIDRLQTLFKDYKEYDIYKWYNEVDKLVA